MFAVKIPMLEKGRGQKRPSPVSRSVGQPKCNPREQAQRSANPCVDDRLRHIGPKDWCAYAVNRVLYTGLTSREGIYSETCDG